jgi:uncharacterized protein
MTHMKEIYGPWGIIAGGSDGVGVAFAHGMAARGINVVLVARRLEVLEAAADDVRSRHGVEVRTVSLDLADAHAVPELARITSDLEIGLLVYNAGGDDRTVAFLDRDVESHLHLVQRNCASVLEASYRFGGPMVERQRGGVVLVTSGAAWVGGSTLASYGATKAFDLILAEALWSEWGERGVHVLGLVLGKTDTPSFRRVVGQGSGDPGDLADPFDVAEEALRHLADGPTWQYGQEDPGAGSPFGAMRRRDAATAMSRAATSLH